MPLWKTATGVELQIKDMGNGHLQNSHRFLRKRRDLEYATKWIGYLEKELRKRKLKPLGLNDAPAPSVDIVVKAQEPLLVKHILEFKKSGNRVEHWLKGGAHARIKRTFA